MSIQNLIEQKLQEQLKPAYLEVVNESNQHNVPAGSESHFKLIIVTDEFKQKNAVVRHRLIYQLLTDYIPKPIHALALHTYTSEEWQHLKQVPLSPVCRGAKK